MAPVVTKFPISGGNNTAATWNSVVTDITGDFIYSGFAPTDGGGLTLSVAAGVAFCAGVRHDVGASSATMGKSTTNYVFYDPATLDYHVDTDNSAPTNSIFLAKVVTDASAITSIADERVFSHIPTQMLTQMWDYTNKGIVTSWTSGSAVYHTNPITGQRSSDMTPTKISTITLSRLPSTTLRIMIVLAAITPGGTGYAQIYKNGVAVGTPRSSTVAATWTENISSILPGDTIELWGWVSTGGYNATLGPMHILCTVGNGIINS